MISLGIDLSLTSTGFVKLENGKIIKQDLTKTKPSGDDVVKGLERLLEIVNSVNLDDVSIAVVEGLAFMARNTSALVQLSGLNYLMREKLYYKHIPFTIVAPTTLKKFATGKGNSPKDSILLEIYKRYGISFQNDNLADAYILARIGEALLGEQKITKFQQEVITLLMPQYQLTKSYFKE